MNFKEEMQVSLSQARLMLTCLDLTSLSGQEDRARIEALCTRAGGQWGQVAAICVFPNFVPWARAALTRLGFDQVRLATVANFPHGALDIDAARGEIQFCLEQGAQEIDLVFPYRAFLAGQVSAVQEFLMACRQACPGVCLKIILESGILSVPELIHKASLIAMDCGADFLKTSTGKSTVHATPEAAQIMLEAIASQGGRVGFKAAGGLTNATSAFIYFSLARTICGQDWISPTTFRLGASGLLDDLRAIISSEGRAS